MSSAVPLTTGRCPQTPCSAICGLDAPPYDLLWTGRQTFTALPEMHTANDLHLAHKVPCTVYWAGLTSQGICSGVQLEPSNVRWASLDLVG